MSEQMNIEEIITTPAVAEREVKREVSVSTTAMDFGSMEGFKVAYQLGKTFASSDLIPQGFKNKPTDCAVAIDLANRMGVSPLMVMQNLYVVQGKPSWSGQACMSLIRANKDFKGVRPVFVGKQGQDDWGCRIEATLADTGEKITGSTVTIGMAKQEGWYAKNGSKWKTMPEQMLQYRAAAFFARVWCPNSLMGFAVEGEAEDIAREEKGKPVEVL